MRARIILALMLTLGFDACTRTHPSSSTITAITTNWFITQFGQYRSPDGIWEVSVAAADQPFKLVRGQYLDHVRTVGSDGSTIATWTGALTNTYATEDWKARLGWFVYVENQSRAWCYDGSNYLWLLRVDSDGSSGSYGPQSFPCPVPRQVYARLSDSAQKAIPKDGN
jgi:hypothetical protein